MIRVGEDDLGVQVARQVALRHAFHRGLGANRHEDRRFDNAVGGVNQTGPRAGIWTDRLELEAHLPNVSVRLNRIKWEESFLNADLSENPAVGMSGIGGYRRLRLCHR